MEQLVSSKKQNDLASEKMLHSPSGTVDCLTLPTFSATIFVSLVRGAAKISSSGLDTPYAETCTSVLFAASEGKDAHAHAHAYRAYLNGYICYQ